MVEAEHGEGEAQQPLDAVLRLLGVLVELGRDEAELVVAVVRDQVGAEEDAGVALEQEGVVGPFRAGRADRQQAAGKLVALGVPVVGLLVGGRGVLG